MCPLSGALLRDAVVALDGVAYDKAAVEAGLLAGPTGAAARFIPHHLLRRLVEAFEAEQKRAWGASRTRTRAGSRVWAVEKAEAIETCAETATAVAVAAIM